MKHVASSMPKGRPPQNYIGKSQRKCPSAAAIRDQARKSLKCKKIPSKIEKENLVPDSDNNQDRTSRHCLRRQTSNITT